MPALPPPPAITLLLPLFRQPNRLALCLEGIARHSVTRPRVIVVTSDETAFGEPSAADFLVDAATDEQRRPFATAQEYIAARGDWAREHAGAEFIDLTAECLAYKAGIDSALWADGHDSGFKLNSVLHLLDDSTLFSTWDADFYPSPGWDAALLEMAAGDTAPLRTFAPVHVQPYIYPSTADFPADIEETRRLHCTHLAYPTTHPACHLAPGDWEAFCARHLDAGKAITEPNGQRNRSHFNPLFWRAGEFRETMGAFGTMGTGFDVEYDDRAGALGFVKHTTYGALCLHKGWIGVDTAALGHTSGPN